MRSLRFRLPAIFLLGVVLAGLVTAVIAIRLFEEYTEEQTVKVLRRQAAGLAALYEAQALQSVDEGTNAPTFAAAKLEQASGAELFYVGVEIFPGQISGLERIHAEYGPVELAVTENGATYPDTVSADGSVDDVERRAYLAGHLAALADARDAGVPVNAYFVWSLLDNFEWAEGYGHRFGIVHVDFETLRRTPKASARWYAEVIRRHGLP